MKKWKRSRRLAFVGMTRAKQELTWPTPAFAEFRGNTLYAVPSMFLDELPPEVQNGDLSASGATAPGKRWITGAAAAPLPKDGWTAAGIRGRAEPIPPAATGGATYTEGMLVNHATYGNGRVTEVSGHGSTRRVKVRFAKAGMKTFAGLKIALEAVEK